MEERGVSVFAAQSRYHIEHSPIIVDDVGSLAYECRLGRLHAVLDLMSP